MFNIVIFGGPGSGKGTQSDKIIEKYGLFHISTGSVLRSHIRRGTELGKIADSYISKGQLIPDDLMASILGDVLDTNTVAATRGVIFDGFPRTLVQAHALNELLESRGMTLNAVIGLEVDDEELTRRIIERGKTSGRSDDNVDAVKQRLSIYHSQTQPLEDYYREVGLYCPIHGVGSIDGIFSHICKAIDSKRK